MKAHNNYLKDVDELLSPSFDLSNLSNATLTFMCAGASRGQSAAEINDVLTIYSSGNCGQTWSQLASYNKAALINNGFYSNSFVPTLNSQWVLKTISIPKIVATSNVRFKFEYTSGNKSNNIYIDDININGTVGIKENTLQNASMSIYPNPSSETSTISYHLNQKADVVISLMDVLGKVITEVKNNSQAEGDYTFLISKHNLNLNNGIYFIRFSVDNNAITQKLVITE
jgi:hypothetical protein